jgi:hypothetical protein
MKLKTLGVIHLTLLAWGSIFAMENSAQMLNPQYGTTGAPMSSFINDSYLLNSQLNTGASRSRSSSSSSSNISSPNNSDLVAKITTLFKRVPVKQRPLIAQQLRASLINSSVYQKATPAQQKMVLSNFSSMVAEAMARA